MALIKCPGCGYKVFDGSGFCNRCGFEFSFCSCGEIVEVGSERCPRCNRKIEAKPKGVLKEALDSGKSEISAAEVEAKAADQRKKRIGAQTKSGPFNDKTRPFRITFEHWHKQSFLARLSSIIPQKRFAVKIINIARLVVTVLLLFLMWALDVKPLGIAYLVLAPLFLGWVFLTDYFDRIFLIILSLAFKKRMKVTGGNLPHITESAFQIDIDDLEGFPRKLHILRLKALVGAGFYTARPGQPIFEFFINTAYALSWFSFRVAMYFAVLIHFVSDFNILIPAIIAVVGAIFLIVSGLVCFILNKVNRNFRSNWVFDNIPGHANKFLKLK